MIDQVRQDRAFHECQIKYPNGINLGNKVVPPSGVDLIPQLQATCLVNYLFYILSRYSHHRE